MKSSVETMEKNQVKITITFEPGEFEKGLQAAYKKTRTRYNVPGFRRGKAPRFMIEQLYGEGAFYQDAFDIIFPDAYDEAVQEHDLYPVSRPDIDITTISKEEGLVAECTIVVKPEVQLGEYLGLQVERKIHEVDDEQVDHSIEHERENVARFLDVTDRPAQMGDEVVIDYEGLLEDVPFEGGADDEFKLELGSGRFIPGFEEQIVGMNIGDERNIDVTFPDDYHSEDLAGKPVIFRIKLHGITAKELPELDDEFAQDVSEFDTFDEYRESVRKKMEEQALEAADNAVENALVMKAAENATIDIPQEMIERQIDYQIRELEFRLMMSGMNLGQYMDYSGMTQAQLRQDQYKRAHDQVRVQLALEAIVKREELKVTDEDWAKEYEKQAEQKDTSWEELKAAEKPDALENKENNILFRKAVEIIKEHAEVSDVIVKPEDEEHHHHAHMQAHQHHHDDHDHEHDHEIEDAEEESED